MRSKSFHTAVCLILVSGSAFGSPRESTPTAQSGPLRTPDIVKRAVPGTVAISGETLRGERIAGSGFIIDSSGTIATNLHVVRDLVRATVTLANGQSFDRVMVRSYDERRDLAIIQISASGLSTLELGDSDAVEVGERVVLIGNPLGLLSGTVSSGIVSAVRPVEGYRVFQTDAPASPGNSGGPMIDEHGRVVGVMTFRVNGGENLNFVVPVNYIRGLLSLNDNLPLRDLKSRLTPQRDVFDPFPSREAAPARPILGPSEDGVPDTHALLYVYRDSGFAGRVWDPPVTVDDVEVVRMDNKRYFSVWVVSGRHAVDAGGGSTQSCYRPVDNTFEAGHIYYLRMDIVGPSCWALRTLNPEVAERDIVTLKPLNPSNVHHKAVRLNAPPPH
jgi:trypsin-like peptidase/uncharacterized protein DUF2846